MNFELGENKASTTGLLQASFEPTSEHLILKKQISVVYNIR